MKKRTLINFLRKLGTTGSTQCTAVGCFCAVFTARSSYASAVLGIAILSVCLSRASWQNERTYCWCFDTIWKSSHSSFLTPTLDGVTSPSTYNLRSKWPTPCKNAFDQSAYNVSTVRASKKIQLSWTGSRARAFQLAIRPRRSAYVITNCPKG